MSKDEYAASVEAEQLARAQQTVSYSVMENAKKKLISILTLPRRPLFWKK